MTIVTFRDQEIESERGEILRDVLLEADHTPHNGAAGTLNCGGHGTCGTCAVEVSGDVSDMTGAERRRLSLPPHSVESGLRLACQIRVEGDVRVTKYPGFFGQHQNQEPTR